MIAVKKDLRREITGLLSPATVSQRKTEKFVADHEVGPKWIGTHFRDKVSMEGTDGLVATRAFSVYRSTYWCLTLFGDTIGLPR